MVVVDPKNICSVSSGVLILTSDVFGGLDKSILYVKEKEKAFKKGQRDTISSFHDA